MLHCFSGGCAFDLFHRPVVIVFWWMGLSGGWGPLPIPGARFPGERILIDPFVGTLLGHARHDCPQKRELLRCVLVVTGQQGGNYTRSELSHEEQGNKMPAEAIFPCARCGKVLF